MGDTARHRLRSRRSSTRPGGELDVLGHRHLLGPPANIELPGVAVLVEPTAERVAQDLATLREGHRHQLTETGRIDPRDIAIARCAVEKEALRRSMLDGGDEWESEIVAAMHGYRKKSAKAFESAEALEAWEQGHDRLHSALISACGSSRLLDLQQRLQEQHGRYRRLIVIPNVQADTHSDEHERLVEMVLNRRFDEAEAMIEHHMMITVDALDSAGFWDSGPASQG